MGRRFVPSSTIRARMDAKDRRMRAAGAACRQERLIAAHARPSGVRRLGPPWSSAHLSARLGRRAAWSKM